MLTSLLSRISTEKLSTSQPDDTMGARKRTPYFLEWKPQLIIKRGLYSKAAFIALVATPSNKNFTRMVLYPPINNSPPNPTVVIVRIRRG